MASASAAPLNTVSRRTAALLVGLAFFLTDLGGASAGAELEAIGSDGARPQEVSFEHEVHLDGLLATIQTTQVLANAGDLPLESVYTFALPRTAAIRALRVTVDGRPMAARIVHAEAATTPVADPDAVDGRPDIAILRMIERAPLESTRRSTATYELVVYPIPAKGTARVVFDWVMPIALMDARAVVRLPERGDADNLVRERVKITTGQAPYGGKFSAAQLSGGSAQGNGKSRSYLAPSRGELVIEAAASPSREMVPWARGVVTPLSNDHGLVAVELAAGAPHLATPRTWTRLIAVVDISRSLGADGINAVRTLTGALLGAVATNADAEVILFDRAPRQLFGGFVPVTPGSLKAADDAIANSPLANGSDLGEALGKVRELLAAEAPTSAGADAPGATTMIVVVTDGNTPLGQTESRLRLRLGDDVMATATLTAVFLAHDAAPLVDVERSPLAALAHRSGGRSLIVRNSEAPLRAQTLATELARPAPVRLDGFSSADGIVNIALANHVLEAGSGALFLGTYNGAAPKQLNLAFQRAGLTQTMVVKLRGDKLHPSAALWLVEQSPGSYARSAGITDAAVAKRGYLSLLSSIATLSPTSALVVVDPRDPYGKDRLSALTRAGAAAFSRMPPKPERAAGFDFVPFEEVADHRTRSTWEADSKTGELDRAIIGRLFSTHVVPRAKVCYENALRRDPHLAGKFTIIAEIIAGEVHHAELEGSTFSGTTVEACVLEVVYGLDIPRVAQGKTAEALGVARYPLRMRRVESGEIEAYNPTPEEMRRVLEPATPLGGLERRDD